MEEMMDCVSGLVENGTFAILAVLTKEGHVVLRSIGGHWSSNITDAAKEMIEKYPGCKIRLFEQNYDAWDRYFKGELLREQML